MAKAKEKVVISTLWSAGCGSHGGCGCEIYVQDGKVTRAEGDPNPPQNQGRLCAKGLAIPQYMYHPDRVTHPLKRVGERGEGKWQQITWDEAYDTIEKRLKDIRAKFGAESAIFATQGHYSVLDASQFLEKRYDSPEWTPPKYIIIWAQNPAAGCHDGFYGHWIIDCMRRGSKLITIAPCPTWFSSRSMLHLQNRPRTDGAIAMGM